MVDLYGLYSATVLKVSGDRALVSFSHPSEPGHKQKMWVPAQDVGIRPTPTLFVEYDGGGVRGACVECGCTFEEYGCRPGQCLFEAENEDNS